MHITIKAKPKDVFEGARRNRTRTALQAKAQQMVSNKVKTRGVSIAALKIGDYVRINLIKASSVEREKELKKFRKI